MGIVDGRKKMDKKIEWKNIRGGQVRLHADSIYEYEIYTTCISEYDVKRFCTSFLRPSKHESGGGFSGACNFPYGLDSFYKFENLGDGKFRYIVCEPYTG
jgi:hypothetical protein